MSSTEIRIVNCQKLREILNASDVDLETADSITRNIEEAVYQESINMLVCQQEATWYSVYNSIISNLLYNITDYKYSKNNITELINNAPLYMNRVLTNGPMILNKDLQTIKELSEFEKQNGGYKRSIAANAGGHVKCPHCKKNEVYMRLVQDRSGDEAMSYYYTCTIDDCGYSWRRSG